MKKLLLLFSHLDRTLRVGKTKKSQLFIKELGFYQKATCQLHR
ncbi:hypothetical protein HMPREF2097_02886 [Enterococcus faecalis 918]|nr:hypothetical protein HMPREF2097_02886 [Enterococcus faecalis 918]